MLSPYPWRCLWRGLLQMTMVRPCRLITRHRSHMGLTEGLTFIVRSWAWKSWANKGRAEAEASPRGSSWYQNPRFRREDAGPVRRDGHGVLEMGRQRGIGGRDRPLVVVDVDVRGAGGDHRLDRDRHALLQLRAAVGRDEIRHLRILVHRAPDAVADEAADDAEARALRDRLDGLGDVADRVPEAGLLDPGLQSRAADVQQPLRVRRDRADGERPGGVRHEAVEGDADVDRQDVAVPHRRLAGNAVHHHRVRRQARRGRIALVALEGRRAPARADELLGDRVELAGGDAGGDALLQQRQRVGDDRTGGGHDLDLLLRLADHHKAPTSSSWSELWISRHTSSIERPACSGTSFPVTR